MKKCFWNRAFVLALALVMVLSLASCKKKGSSALSKAATSADSPGWKENAANPVQFDWYINFSWFSRQWGQSKVSKYITEKTGVDIRFIVPAGNEAERLNAMIAGNSLPDIITLAWYEGQVNMMIDAGMVEPINKLAEQYDPYFFKVANAERLGWYTQSDGNVYGYPNSSFTPSDYEKYHENLIGYENFLVRKDLYEALGQPDMSTPEGFLATLRAAKAKFPTVDGQPIIPFAMESFSDTGNNSLQGYLQHFLGLLPETNGLYDDPNYGRDNPEYIRWLKTFRQAASEGLIPMDVFVDGRPQIEEKATQGRYFALLYPAWNMQAPEANRYANDPNSVYIAIRGPASTTKADPVIPGGGIAGWTLTMISKNCKDKARAIQFLSYLISEEGQLDIFFGVPDETYTWVDGKPTYTPEVHELNFTDKNKQEVEIGLDATYWMLMDVAWYEQYRPGYPASIEQPVLWTNKYVTSFAAYDNIEMPVGSDEALIADDIQRRWGKDLPRLLLAKTDAEFDTIWNDFQKYKKDAGFAKVQAAQTAKVKANKAKLGVN